MASSSGCARQEVARSLPGVAGRGASVCRSEGPEPDQRFPRSLRLTARRQFLTVYERGWKTSSASFTVFGIPNGLDRWRLGLTVTRKFGGAVARNRAKRLLRELFRRHRERLGRPMDLVVNGRSAMLRKPAARLEDEFLTCIAELVRRAQG